MSTIEGVVDKVFKNSAGFFNVKLRDGGWYGFGKYKPKCNEGDKIGFNWTASPNGQFMNADTKSLEIKSSEVVAAPSVKSSASPTTDWDSKDKRIQWMSSRNAAIEFMKIALEQGAVKIPTKQSDKLAALEAALYDYTAVFYWDTMDAPNKTNDVAFRTEEGGQVEDYD